MADNHIQDAVRLEAEDASEGNSDALYGLDWRSAKTNGGYTLAVLPYDAKPPFDVELVTDAPIKKILNLITEKEIAPNAFALADGPNLFWIELVPDS